MSKENKVSDERLTEMLASAKHDVENQTSQRYKAEAEEQVAILAEIQSLRSKLVAEPPIGTFVSIGHDGFTGDCIGHYVTREGKAGMVLQQEGTKVVHVYGVKWLQAKEPI